MKPTPHTSHTVREVGLPYGAIGIFPTQLEDLGNMLATI